MEDADFKAIKKPSRNLEFGGQDRPEMPTSHVAQFNAAGLCKSRVHESLKPLASTNPRVGDRFGDLSSKVSENRSGGPAALVSEELQAAKILNFSGPVALHWLRREPKPLLLNIPLISFLLIELILFYNVLRHFGSKCASPNPKMFSALWPLPHVGRIETR